jgi:eukaryotic-like serine/threonine-protein kinase
MKRCPQCNRVEPDDALTFCRADGTPLVRESGSAADAAGTLKLSPSQSTHTSETRILPAGEGLSRTTAPTTVLAPHPAAGGTRESGEPKSRSKILIVVGAVVAAALALSGYLYLPRGRNDTAIKSIAVLPFQNASGDPDTEYLSDGISESLINSLSQLPNVRVMARTTMFTFKGRDADPQQVGRQLRVDVVLAGRVVQRGDNLAIQAELVNVADGSQVWGERYDRKLTDIVALQGEVSRAVSDRLRARLTGAGERMAAKNHTADPEAHQLYLKGRYQINRLTDEGFLKAGEYFRQATEKDPNYALAYAGLADSYNLLSGFNALPPNEGFPKARAAAVKALELDDRLAEAHTVLATVRFLYEWDWAGAEREFRRAVDVNPNYANAHEMYAYYLAVMGRTDEALAEVRRARQLDPLSLSKAIGEGDVFRYGGRYDQAVEEYRKALELDPNSGLAHWALGNAYTDKRMYEQAIAEYRKSIPLSGDSPDEPASLAYAYALSGRRDEAVKLLNELKQRSSRSYISPTIFALINIGLGQKDQAFEWLYRAYDGRDFMLTLLQVEPAFEPLRSDPRFAELVRKVGLPQ